jgi:hypothetical protein
MIRPVPAACNNCGRQSGQKTLVQRADSGDFHIRRHATWGMPDKNYLSRVADEV